MKAMVVKIALLVASCVPALTGAPALARAAEEYEKVEGQVRETIPAAPYLASAYAFIWVAVLVYVITVARRLRRVQTDIEELRARVARDTRA